ncbi:MAG TPA: hypothetical protein VGO47_00690, partial [Chlamydiales bacterium]|nr:hypothetical protein [Chlamydiales bacterium]
MSSPLTITTSSARITHLNKDNYYAWKQKMSALLIEAELWKIVLGEEKRPVPAKPDTPTESELQKISAWDEKDRKTLSAIILRVSDEYLVYLDSIPSAAEAWKKLRNIFESRGPLTITHLWRRLYRLQAPENSDLENHVRQLEDIMRSLRNRGENIEDGTIKNLILASMPETDFWENFITSITTARTDMTSQDLIGEILDTDRRRNQGEKKETALKFQERRSGPIAKFSNNRRPFQSSATKGICRNCGKKGHWVADCWEKGGGQAGNMPKWFKPKKEQVQQADSNEGDRDWAFMAGTTNTTAWLSDTAATCHITPDKSNFSSYRADPSEIDGIVPGVTLKSLGIGTVNLQFKIEKNTYTIPLREVRYCPDAPNNLISIGRLTDAGHTAIFNSKEVQFISSSGIMFAKGHKVGRVYEMNASATNMVKQQERIAVAMNKRTWDEWHRILGHIHFDAIKNLFKSGLVTGMTVDEAKLPTQCEACIQGKQHTIPVPNEATEHDIAPGEVAVSDVWGPAQSEGSERELYYYSFTD